MSSRFEQIRDLAWTPGADEIWVSGRERGRASRIYAVPLAGAQRLIAEMPGAIFLLDFGRDDRALVAHGSGLSRMVWSRGTDEREVSWLDWSTVADLSADGKTILFYEWGEAMGAKPAVYLRRIDGGDPVRLGDGKALALSHDGRWALALQETPHQQLVLLPTGAGAIRLLPAEGLTDFYWARWFPDGRRLLVVGARADGVPGSFIQHLDTGRLEPIAEKGMLAVLVSPDGHRLLVNDPLDGIPPVGTRWRQDRRARRARRARLADSVERRWPVPLREGAGGARRPHPSLRSRDWKERARERAGAAGPQRSGRCRHGARRAGCDAGRKHIRVHLLVVLAEPVSGERTGPLNALNSLTSERAQV